MPPANGLERHGATSFPPRAGGLVGLAISGVELHGATSFPLRAGGLVGLAIVGVLCGALAGCRPAMGPEPAVVGEAAYVPYLERRAAHATALRVDGPSTGRYERGFVPEGVLEVRYPSGDLELLAWLALPPAAADGGKAPGLVYFHGAFSLGPKDLAAVQPFLDAGLVVMMPALRGENGNPGRLELLYGEVDDGAAAVRWLAARPEVDGAHVYAVGHSIGGGLAALLALRPDAPVRLTGSVGGLYVPETFARWSRSEGNAALVRFDPFDPDEASLRTLAPNVRDVVHPHHAYLGDDDTVFHANGEVVRTEAARWRAPVTVERVPGDHMSCLTPALPRFLARIEADLQ
jgi:dienelactone hydrolase